MTTATKQAQRFDDAVEARLWKRIRVVASGCWEWTGKLSQGYGRMEVRRRSIAAHRVAYQVFVGPIADGKQLDHLCRNTCCVNPAHLEPVTSRENTLRGFGPTARHARQQACRNGHALTGANLYVRTSGQRVCKACRRVADKAFREANSVSRNAYARAYHHSHRRPS